MECKNGKEKFLAIHCKLKVNADAQQGLEHTARKLLETRNLGKSGYLCEGFLSSSIHCGDGKGNTKFPGVETWYNFVNLVFSVRDPRKNNPKRADFSVENPEWASHKDDKSLFQWKDFNEWFTEFWGDHLMDDWQTQMDAPEEQGMARPSAAGPHSILTYS